MAHPPNNPICDSKGDEQPSCSKNHRIVQNLLEKEESSGQTISKGCKGKFNSRKRKLSRPHQIPEEAEVTRITCYFCSKTFSSYSNLRLHLATHNGEKTFNCQICKVEFIRKDQLSSHNWSHHLTPEDKERVKAGSCYFCAKPFQSYSTLQSHLLTHTQEKHFNCSTCKKQFTHKSHLDNHTFQHLSAEEQEKGKSGWRHPCEFCGLRFKIQSTLYTHITVQHTKEKHYQCQICRKEFNQQGTLTRHLRSHSDDPSIRKPFSCPQCQKSFTSKGRLESHLFLHLPPEEQVIEKERRKESWKHSCAFCGARYPFESLLNLHIIGVHTNEKQFPCPKCRKEFKQQGHLTRHLRGHSTDPAIRRPFNCSQCRKSFTQKESLIHHEKTVHQGLKEFPCPQCHKHFSTKSHLKSHFFAHFPPEEQERRKETWKHSCGLCGARYPNESLLNLHIIGVHTNEKHFPCPKCKKEFKQQGDLTRHLRTHSEDPATRKPFSCSQCQKSFTNKSHLTHHEKTVHLGLKEFPCPQCNKLFSTKSHLTRHLASVHAMVRHSCSHCSKTFSRKSDARSHEKKAH